MEHVIVSVIGFLRDAQQEESSIEQEMLGTCRRNDRMTIIRYTDSELAEGALPTETVLNIQQDKVILVREGAIRHRLEFFRGGVTHGTYVSPFGQFLTTIKTRQLEITQGSGTMSLDIVYELEIDGQWQSENRLSVNVRGLRNRGH